MEIGIKYCGGCNPRYDRKEFAGYLESRFGRRFEAADTSKEYDVLIVLCGCSSGCAGISMYRVRGGSIVMVKSESDFDAAVKAVEKLLDNE